MVQIMKRNRPSFEVKRLYKPEHNPYLSVNEGKNKNALRMFHPNTVLNEA